MIRVKIGYHDGTIKGKVLRFDESIDFEELLRKIVQKLGIYGIELSRDAPLSDLFELTLGGSNVIEDTSEIDHDDDLILRMKDSSQAQTEPIRSQDNIKKEEESADEENEKEQEIVVEDVTEDMKKKNCIASQPNADDVISLSGDSDSEESDGSVEGGSDAWEAEFKESEDEHSDVGAKEDNSENKKRKRSFVVESPLEVIMNERDMPTAPGKPAVPEENPGGLEEVSTLVQLTGKQKTDQAVKDRIIKLLNTGFHDKSNEHEAKNAMKLAQRLMTKHNLSQAILLKEREAKNNDEKNEILKGGIVHVHIVNRKTRKPAQYERWINGLTIAVQKNFGVKTYHSTRRGKNCSVSFYGIYTNAQLAAYAFRVATERIAQMKAEFQPKRGFYSSPSTRSSRLSYSLGIVQGISNDVDRNIRLEKEGRERKLARARMAASQGEAYDESENEDEGVFSQGDDNENNGQGFTLFSGVGTKGESSSAAMCGDGNLISGKQGTSVSPDRQVDARASKPKLSLSGVDLENRVEQLEKEEQAALVLVDHSNKIAEDVLKENNIKLSSGRKNKPIQFDRRAYDQGVEDSKEIDINQRAIRDEVKVKKEVKQEGGKGNKKRKR